MSIFFYCGDAVDKNPLFVVAVISNPTMCDVCVKEMIFGAVVFCLTILTPIAKRKRGDHLDVECKLRECVQFTV